MYILLSALAFATLPADGAPLASTCPCVQTATSIDCDLNVQGKGGSNTTLIAWRDANRSQYVFSGTDGAGVLFECRFADFSVGGIDPDDYWVIVTGTPQNDQVNITTYFTGFSFIAGDGNDLAFGPPDAHDIYLDMGEGNDWVDVWGDTITADLGPGDDVAIYGGDAHGPSITYGGDGNDCVLGRPNAHDYFFGEDGDDLFDSRGNCMGPACHPETAVGGPGLDECAVSVGMLDCEITNVPFFLTCPPYIP